MNINLSSNLKGIVWNLSLAREEKLLSCSISSKNSYLILLRSFCFNHSLFQSGKWCKGKNYFSNFQIFLEKFLKNFFLRTFRFFKESFPYQSGCKGKNYFSNFQIIFEENLKNFLKNLLQSSRSHFLVNCGCKGTQKIHFCKLFDVFFQKFYNYGILAIYTYIYYI